MNKVEKSLEFQKMFERIEKEYEQYQPDQCLIDNDYMQVKLYYIESAASSSSNFQPYEDFLKGLEKDKDLCDLKATRFHRKSTLNLNENETIILMPSTEDTYSRVRLLLQPFRSHVT